MPVIGLAPPDVTVECTKCNWCVALRSDCVRNQTPVIQSAASLITDGASTDGHSNTDHYKMRAGITTLQAGRTEVRIPAEAWNISLLQNIEVGFGVHPTSCGPGSVVGIATGYGLDGPGIETRWGARFFAPVQTATGAQPASFTMGTASFPGVKRPGRDADPSTSSSAVVKKELYLYSPYGPYSL